MQDKTNNETIGTNFPEKNTFDDKLFKNRNIRSKIRRRDCEEGIENEDILVKRFPKTRQLPLLFSTQKPEKKIPIVFKATRKIGTSDGNATRALETEKEFDRDEKALREKVLSQANTLVDGKEFDDGIYRGMTGFIDYRKGLRREHNAALEKSSGSHGPLRTSLHIRNSSRFDYQPDICKDYKETGYCGYGQACKFLHDRSDYKPGWQIDHESSEKDKKEWPSSTVDFYDSNEVRHEEEEIGLPFACLLCREPWEKSPSQEPVKTICRHYYHEECALKHDAKTGKCYVCEKMTKGIFNVAVEIIHKVRLNSQKEKSK